MPGIIVTDMTILMLSPASSARLRLWIHCMTLVAEKTFLGIATVLGRCFTKPVYCAISCAWQRCSLTLIADGNMHFVPTRPPCGSAHTELRSFEHGHCYCHVLGGISSCGYREMHTCTSPCHACKIILVRMLQGRGHGGHLGSTPNTDGMQEDLCLLSQSRLLTCIGKRMQETGRQSCINSSILAAGT